MFDLLLESSRWDDSNKSIHTVPPGFYGRLPELDLISRTPGHIAISPGISIFWRKKNLNNIFYFCLEYTAIFPHRGSDTRQSSILTPLIPYPPHQLPSHGSPAVLMPSRYHNLPESDWSTDGPHGIIRLFIQEINSYSHWQERDRLALVWNLLRYEMPTINCTSCCGSIFVEVRNLSSRSIQLISAR